MKDSDALKFGWNLKDMLAAWNDPLGSRTMSDAEDLIHALQVEISGMNGHIKTLEDDLKYYKLRDGGSE